MDTHATPRPSFAEAFRFWLKLGCLSFGGPTGQIAIMHAEVVEKRRWVSEAQFLHALNFCMLLPGPEAQQLAIYLGWLLHRTLGGLVAGILFVLPSAVLLWALSWIYVSHGNQPWLAGVLAGLKPAVLAIVAAAVIRIGGKVLKNSAMWAIAAAAFAALFVVPLFCKASVPFPFIVLGAGLVGYLGGARFAVLTSHEAAESSLAADPPRPTVARALRVLAMGLAVWWLPVFALGAWLGKEHTVIAEALFFSKAALVTFGGAYTVLPYVAQQAVELHGWLSAGQMLDGLGLAETTPGPLIMVLQFVGFLGAWNHPGTLSPLAAATLGAAITTWTTFVPCFIWIFLGAPHIERLRADTRLTAALSAITAAVVGVILNLALWFAAQVLLPGGKPDTSSLILCAVAFAALHWRKWNIIPVVLSAAALGALRALLFP